MMSLRSIARSVPRTTARFINVSSRPCRSAILSHASLKSATPLRIASAFSTSRPQLDNRPELVEKLNEELAVEQEESQEDGMRDGLKQYLDSSDFQLEDIPGSQEVALTRTFGDEKIRVVFSLADFNQEEGVGSAEDDALYDEDMPEEGQSGGGNTKGAINQGRTKGGNFQIAPEDDIAPADRDEFRNDNEVQGQGSFPVRMHVHVTRQGKGALTISCIADDGEIQIEDIYSYTKPELADAKTAEQEFAGRGVYTGPPFHQLDESLQELIESYLEERGINTAMALFIPEYVDMKEQKEYVRWLGNMKTFFN